MELASDEFQNGFERQATPAKSAASTAPTLAHAMQKKKCPMNQLVLLAFHIECCRTLVLIALHFSVNALRQPLHSLAWNVFSQTNGSMDVEVKKP